ncbi:MAG: RluA family pseudouridine synthase [Hellea sp.]
MDKDEDIETKDDWLEGTWHAATAEAGDVGIRVDKWLAGWTQLSRARLRVLVETGQVRANGDILKNPTKKVRDGVEYAVFVPPPVDDTPQPENIPLDILYEDDQLIVVNKPAGMTVHPAPGSRSATLVNALLHHCTDSLSGIGGVMRPGIVHRIDKDTSGALVVAKTDIAHRYLSKQFAKHTVERVYVCLVRSIPKPREGQIVSRIARSTADRKKQAVVRGTMNNLDATDHGRHAITNYKYVKGYGQQPNAAVGVPQVSMIECRLETGRTHQIRVHLAHIGCPLLGDPLYGKQRAFLTSKSPGEVAVKEAMSTFKRQALHAVSLGFKHPVTKEFMVFETPLAPEMANLVTALEQL